MDTVVPQRPLRCRPAARLLLQSDSLFDHPATEYDNQLALATLGMAVAADCPWESDQRYWMEGEVGRADHIRDAFAKLGFTEVQLFNYTHSLNDTPDTVGLRRCPQNAGARRQAGDHYRGVPAWLRLRGRVVRQPSCRGRAAPTSAL